MCWFCRAAAHLLDSKNIDLLLFCSSITRAVVQLFQKKKLEENELHSIQENVRHLNKECGPLIYDYYKVFCMITINLHVSLFCILCDYLKVCYMIIIRYLYDYLDIMSNRMGDPNSRGNQAYMMIK